MPALNTHQLSFQLDNGDWLFRNLNLTLNKQLTGLVGRNGVGKSILISLLMDERNSTEGFVEKVGNIGHYSQLPSQLLNSDTSIACFLGVSDKLNAIKNISEGSCSQSDFDAISDDWDIENRLVELLESLGIQSDINVCCHTLSGGQMAMLQLHKLFDSNADILLLDEPTNHLDSFGRQWLIQRLKAFIGKVLVVSHDRVLLDHMQAIYQLTGLGLNYFTGNYQAYFEQTQTQQKALDQRIDNLKAEQKKIEKQAQKNKEAADQRAAQGNRLRKSGSQPKILMDAMKNKAEKNRSAALKNQTNQSARNQTKLQELEIQKEAIKPQAFYLPQENIVKKRTLLNVENCQLKRVSSKSLTFTISQVDKCHLSGMNGCGKSTLLKAINDRPLGDNGSIKKYEKTVYLDQHFGLLNESQTILESLIDESELPVNEARILLAGIGFRRESVYRLINKLSGGEKMKLSMLICSHQKQSPLLLLDEPDNHLDIESKNRLSQALSDYNGAFILVSHDPYFVNATKLNKQVIIN